MLAIPGQTGNAAGGRSTGPTGPARASGPSRMLANGGHLFTEGELRTGAYRVENGALCHYIVWPDGHHEVIEFIFPGGIVGLGHLPEYISTAQAIADTTVTTLEAADLSQALAADSALATRLSAAADREFEFVRSRALGAGGRPAVQRLASYLLAMASSACRSGELPVIAGGTDMTALAHLLAMSPDELASAWAELRGRDLVGESEHGLVLRNRAALEQLADATG